MKLDAKSMDAMNQKMRKIFSSISMNCSQSLPSIKMFCINAWKKVWWKFEIKDFTMQFLDVNHIETPYMANRTYDTESKGVFDSAGKSWSYWIFWGGTVCFPEDFIVFPTTTASLYDRLFIGEALILLFLSRKVPSVIVRWFVWSVLAPNCLAQEEEVGKGVFFGKAQTMVKVWLC